MINCLRLLSIFALTSLCFAQTDAGSKILLIVNKDPITQHDLNQRIKLVTFSAGGQVNVGETQKAEILNSLVQERLQLQAAKLKKIEVSSKEVDSALTEMAKENKMTLEQLINLLRTNGISKETLASRMKAQIAWARYIRQQYAPVVFVSEAEAERALQKMSNDKITKEYLLSEISLIARDKSQEAQLATTASSLVADLKAGAKFEVLAQQLSKSTSAAKGGDLGWKSNAQVEPEIAAQLSKLAIGEVSAPIKVRDGYKIIKVRDIRHAEQRGHGEVEISFTQAVFPITPDSSPEEIEALAPKIQEVMACKTPQDFSRKAADCSAAVQNTPHVSWANIPEQLRKLLKNVPSGKCAQPVMTPNGLIVTYVCDKREPKPIVHTKDDILSNLEQERFGRQAAREMQKLMSSAHIEAKDEWARRTLKL
ncbi:peptidylprolyl isomerase [Candidatus Odyssella thessalonicensis]|uniref:peptidylprolyl isomerase n=1 Tax=Candidatus Odyssella thessalonicensis TaxID=84647 RepID=UPI000225BB20|nr:peptidylprolyl isomerase [Candidatus Odyssella thessalonicensis]